MQLPQDKLDLASTESTKASKKAGDGDGDDDDGCAALVDAEAPQSAVGARTMLSLSELGAQSVDGLEQHDNVPPTFQSIRTFMLELTSFLYKASMNGGQCPDAGCTWVKIEEKALMQSKKNQLELTSVNEKVHFNFVGPVTMVPQNGAIKICRCFGTDFFVVAGSGATPAAANSIVPAWMVPDASLCQPIDVSKLIRSDCDCSRSLVAVT